MTKIVTDGMLLDKRIFGVYTDAVNEDGVVQCYPSYTPNTILNDFVVINTPLFTRQKLQFNEELQHLIFFDVLRSTCRQLLWYHLATPLTIINKLAINPIQDLQLLQGISHGNVV